MEGVSPARDCEKKFNTVYTLLNDPKDRSDISHCRLHTFTFGESL